jgi:hypothetical protein
MIALGMRSRIGPGTFHLAVLLMRESTTWPQAASANFVIRRRPWLSV